MTNAAMARRPDFLPAKSAPRNLPEIARATGVPVPLTPPSVPDPPVDAVPPNNITSNAATNALQVIATYIPTEVLSLYVACIAVLHKNNGVTTAEWIAFASFLVLTPFVVWLVFAIKLKSAQKAIPLKPSLWPVWEMSAATIAYVAWAYALPGTPFSEFAPESYSPGLAGLMVLVVSTLLGAVAPLFQRPLNT